MGYLVNWGKKFYLIFNDKKVQNLLNFMKNQNYKEKMDEDQFIGSFYLQDYTQLNTHNIFKCRKQFMK